MTKSIMRWNADPSVPIIDFWVRASGDEGLNQIAFVVLTAYKFDGEIRATDGTSKNGAGHKEGNIRLKFEDMVKQGDAKAHCYGHLDENGVVMPSYVGALERADPGLREATAILLQFR